MSRALWPWAGLVAVLALAAPACKDRPPEAAPVSEPAPVTTAPAPSPEALPGTDGSPVGRADGPACLSGADCASGICEGVGCGDDTPGHCVDAPRPCTRDLATWCGCDGVTFQNSGSCPGRRVAHRGACEGAP